MSRCRRRQWLLRKARVYCPRSHGPYRTSTDVFQLERFRAAFGRYTANVHRTMKETDGARSGRLRTLNPRGIWK